jgi:hypothetical protein
MLWRPPRPDHIKIQKITKVKEVEPDKIIGFWRGVSGKVIDIISLEQDKGKDSIHPTRPNGSPGREGEKKRMYRPGLRDNQGFI